MRTIDLTLPYPPTANTMFPSGKNGRRYLSDKGRKYRQEVYARTLEQLGIFKPLQGPISVTIGLYPPDKRKRDLDNNFKAVFDALEEANVYMDDSQIETIHAYRRDVVKGGNCIIQLKSSNEEANYQLKESE